jgi:hypothetical protein
VGNPELSTPSDRIRYVKLLRTTTRSNKNKAVIDRTSLVHLVRHALSSIAVEIERLGHAVQVLDAGVVEMRADADPDELRQCAGTLRAGVLHVLVSLIGVSAGIGAVELAADLWMHIESEEPLE